MAIKKNVKIAGIGEVVYDIFQDSRKIGGAPVDFLHQAQVRGAETFLISAIGADDLGREVVSELNKLEINPVLAITPYPTGRVLIYKSGDSFCAHILENAAWDYIPFTNNAKECIKKVDAIYYDSLALRKQYSSDTILDLIDDAQNCEYKFFDANFRHNYYTKETVLKLLKRSNILKLNADELKIIKSMLNLKGNALDICLKLKKEYNLKYVIYNDAAKESRIWGIDNYETIMKNSRVHQAFAYGAGNAFAGAFLVSIMNGLSQEEAHKIANDAGLEICKQNQNKGN